jgi:signal transduction histidine kinase
VAIHGVGGGLAVGRLMAGLPLRVRLAAAACCAAAVGGATIGFACTLAVRADLMAQADQQVRAYTALLASRPFRLVPDAPQPGNPAAAGFVVEVVSATKRVVLQSAAADRPGPALAELPAGAGQPATVQADRGAGSWLVLAVPVHYGARRLMFSYGTDEFTLDVTSQARPGTPGTLVVGLDLRHLGQAVNAIMIRSAAVGGTVILLVGLAALVMFRALLRPLGRAEQIAAIAATDGPSRREAGGPAGSVADSLARSSTATLSRLDEARQAADAARNSADRMRRLLTGTCDELRRPISVIAGSAAYYRQQGPLPSQDLDHLVNRIRHEAARAGALVDDLAAAAERTES